MTASGERRAASVERAIVGAVLSITLSSSALLAQSAPLLSEARIDSLPAATRSAWHAYLERSRRLDSLNRAAMAAELRSAGQTAMRKATYGRGFEVTRGMMTEAWMRSDSARRLVRPLVTWQTPAGGWSKRTDMSRRREPGESWYGESDRWHYIGTIDNGATTSQLRLLGPYARATGDGIAHDAYVKGIRYLLDAQMPNGCWPQVFPLQGGYPDAVTFNDDAIVNVLEVLTAAEVSPMLDGHEQNAVDAAIKRGRACLLDAQVVVNGVRTVWGQQHDPLTLAPIKARSYELAGLSGKESAAIMTYLMTIPAPDARVVAAVDAAAAYFERTKIFGYEYAFDTGLRAKAGAGPIWARLSEIGTDRPIFANRDGVTLYDWNQLTDRRTGYAWYGTEPGSALAKYAKWKRARERAAAPRPIPVTKKP